MGPYQSARQKERGGGWVGPHIYDNQGELVWSGIPLLNGFNAFDFRVTQVDGEDMLSMSYWHKYGVIVDSNYKIHQEVHHTDGGFNQHDFNIVDNGTRALVMTTQAKRASRKVSHAVGYKGKCKAAFDGFEEYDLATGERTHDWTSFERIGLDESYYNTDNTIESRCDQKPWDFMHGNSIDKFPDGDYLLSARHTNTVYKVSGKDGSIVWRLGGRRSDFQFDDKFSGQHHCRVQSQNETHTILTIMDNAISDNTPETSGPYSRGLLVSLRTDQSPMTAEVLSKYEHPRGDYAHGRGSFQILPNGNAFLGWTQFSMHSEHKANGEVIMEAIMKPELKSYRSYKYQWVGHPTAPPDVYSIATNGHHGSTSTAVYVSWNGATEVATWNLYKSTPDGEASDLVATTPRRGFETTLVYDGFADYVVAEAVAHNGTALGKSLVFKTVAPASETPSADMIKEEQWLQNRIKSSAASIVSNPLFAFVGGFIACVLAVLLGAGIWRCTSRPQTVTRWWQRPHKYGRVAEVDNKEEDEFEDSDDGADLEKKEVRVTYSQV